MLTVDLRKNKISIPVVMNRLDVEKLLDMNIKIVL